MSAAKLSKHRFAIEIKNGPKGGERLEFDKDRIRIGRSPDNDLSFPTDPKMSRHHAVIEVMGDEILISNVSEKNVLSVNGTSIRAHNIQEGDKIHVGTTDLVFHYVQYGVARAETQDLAVVPSSGAVLQGAAVPAASHPAAPPNAVPPTMPASASAGGQQQQRPSWEAPAPKKSKMPFYLLVASICGFFLWILTSSSDVTDEELGLRTREQIKADLNTSEALVQDIQQRRKKSGKNSRQYDKAQAAFVKGRRDFQQGFYNRAIQSFQATLSIFPDHVLARQYLRLSKRKYDETIQLTMIQARKYREKGNYKLCKSNFGLVMTMIRDNQKSIYREAKQFHDECALMLEGRY